MLRRYRRDFNLYDALEFYVRVTDGSVSLPRVVFFLSTWNHNSQRVNLIDFATSAADGWFRVFIPLNVRGGLVCGLSHDCRKCVVTVFSPVFSCPSPPN